MEINIFILVFTHLLSFLGGMVFMAYRFKQKMESSMEDMKKPEEIDEEELNL